MKKSHLINTSIIMLPAILILNSCSVSTDTTSDCNSVVINFSELDHTPKEEEIEGVYQLSQYNEFSGWDLDSTITAVVFRYDSGIYSRNKYIIYNCSSAYLDPSNQN